MSDFQQREALISAYPHSAKWKARVQKMPSAQVTAIFLKFRSEGKINL